MPTNKDSNKTILITGGTGTVGSALVTELSRHPVSIRVLVRNQDSAAKLPNGVESIQGDLSDPLAVRKALEGIDQVYLLNAVVPDELTQASIVLGLAKRGGVRHLVYHSVFRAEQFKDVPHFLSKWALEQALSDSGMFHTILRPNYFFQNEVPLRKPLTEAGVYTMPLGTKGVSAVDVRDIAEAAAVILTDEEGTHRGKTYDLVGPDALTGQLAAGIWTEALGKEVRYGGHDMDRFEEQMRSMMPAWSAYDLRRMFEAYVQRGFAAQGEGLDKLTQLLGHPPRRYRDFVRDTAQSWAR